MTSACVVAAANYAARAIANRDDEQDNDRRSSEGRLYVDQHEIRQLEKSGHPSSLLQSTCRHSCIGSSTPRSERECKLTHR